MGAGERQLRKPAEGIFRQPCAESVDHVIEGRFIEPIRNAQPFQRIFPGLTIIA